LSLAAQAARLSVWVWDVRRDELQMPDATRSLRGYEPDEWIDIERFLSTVHPDDRERVERQVRESLERPGPFEREYRAVLPDGRVRWMEAIGVVESDAQGAPTRVRGVSIDVTERKVAQLEYEKNRDELAHLARFTTLGELSGSLAHELNQPLAAILSNAEAAQRFLAHDPPETGELRAILEDIVAEDERAGEVIGRLRALFKKGEVVFQPTDLSAAILDVLRLLRSELVAHDIAIVTDLPPSVPLVRADRIQIQQILLNLVKNASDAMSHVPVVKRRLTLSLHGNGNGHVRVSVRDTGTGIRDDVLDRLFQPFVTTKPDGMGLGLAVCRTIVDAHRGILRAENNEEGGATFEFTLPVSEELSPGMSTRAAGASDARERVCVVDDDDAVRRSLSRLLRSAGYEPAVYASADEFLAGVSTETAGCAVLDLSMPGLDGLAVQRELAARGSAMAVVFVSGRGDVPNSVTAMKEGAVDFLTKPVRSAALLEAVEKALTRVRERREFRRARRRTCADGWRL
jgi:PAS domain S-box-containing protein